MAADRGLKQNDRECAATQSRSDTRLRRAEDMKQQHTQFSRPNPHDDLMTDLLTALIDQGLTRGLLAMQYTHGLSIHAEVARQYDVAAVAAVRLLDTLPAHVTVGEVLAGLNRRAVALDQSDAREVM